MRIVNVVVILIDSVIGQRIKKGKEMKLLGYLLKIAIYSVIAFIICSPCLGTWGYGVCAVIALLVGFTWGFLNEIHTQLTALVDLIKGNKQ